MMDSPTKDKILRAGIAAPSADNSQPWKFMWQGDRLDVWIDGSRAGGVSDSRYVLSDLATGACLENMLIRGRSLGHAARVQVFPGNDELWAARLHWQPTGGPSSTEPLAEAIEQRCTDRRFPWVGPIAADVRMRLETQLQSSPAVGLHWLETKQKKRAALSVLRQAETLRFKSSRLHAELFSSIRFSSGWRATCAEGLPPATLAVEAPLRPMFQALQRPRIMAGLKRLGAAPMLGFRSADLPIRLSPGLCLLSIRSLDRATVLTAGRACERLWLQAALERLSVQPFAAAGVLSLGFITIEPRFTRARVRLQRAMQALCPGGHGLLFFRLGHAESKVDYRSGRRPLESFLQEV